MSTETKPPLTPAQIAARLADITTQLRDGLITSAEARRLAAQVRGGAK